MSFGMLKIKALAMQSLTSSGDSNTSPQKAYNQLLISLSLFILICKNKTLSFPLSCLTKVKSTMFYDDVWVKVSYCIIMHSALKIKVYDANIKCRVNLLARFI